MGVESLCGEEEKASVLVLLKKLIKVFVILYIEKMPIIIRVPLNKEERPFDKLL